MEMCNENIDLPLYPVFQYIEEFVIILSKTGRIIFINYTALSLYQWEYDDVIEKPLVDLLKESRLRCLLLRKIEFSNKNHVLLENIETIFDNVQKIVSWRITPYKIGRSADGTLLVGKDITKIRRTEEKIFELESIIAQIPGTLYWFSKDNIYLG